MVLVGQWWRKVTAKMKQFNQIVVILVDNETDYYNISIFKKQNKWSWQINKLLKWIESSPFQTSESYLSYCNSVNNSSINTEKSGVFEARILNVLLNKINI